MNYRDIIVELDKDIMTDLSNCTKKIIIAADCKVKTAQEIVHDMKNLADNSYIRRQSQ